MSEGITRRQALEVIKKGAAIGSTMFVLNKLFGNPFLKNDLKDQLSPLFHSNLPVVFPTMQ